MSGRSPAARRVTKWVDGRRHYYGCCKRPVAAVAYLVALRAEANARSTRAVSAVSGSRTRVRSGKCLAIRAREAAGAEGSAVGAAGRLIHPEPSPPTTLHA